MALVHIAAPVSRILAHGTQQHKLSVCSSRHHGSPVVRRARTRAACAVCRATQLLLPRCCRPTTNAHHAQTDQHLAGGGGGSSSRGLSALEIMGTVISMAVGLLSLTAVVVVVVVIRRCPLRRNRPKKMSKLELKLLTIGSA